MINVIVPLAGPNQFFEDTQYPYPKPLIEVAGRTMIELFIENLKKISQEIHFIFIINEADCKKYHIDNVLNILTDHKCELIKLAKETKGAACSVLMAIETINNDKPLIIANADQYLEIDFDHALNIFQHADAGVITFKSVHPRWSYVKLDEQNRIVETAEKKPISNHAIAGFYYFQKGRYFVEGAMEMIKKDAAVNGLFYNSAVFNELVLKNRTLLTYPIKTDQFHTFYTPQKIEEYERGLQC